VANRFGPRLFLPVTVRDELSNVAPAPAALGIEDSVRGVAHERPDSEPGFLSHEIQQLGETKQVTECLLHVEQSDHQHEERQTQGILSVTSAYRTSAILRGGSECGRAPFPNEARQTPAPGQLRKAATQADLEEVGTGRSTACFPARECYVAG